MSPETDAGLPEAELTAIDGELDARFAFAGDDPIVQEIRRVCREELIAAKLNAES